MFVYNERTTQSVDDLPLILNSVASLLDTTRVTVNCIAAKVDALEDSVGDALISADTAATELLNAVLGNITSINSLVGDNSASTGLSTSGINEQLIEMADALRDAGERGKEETEVYTSILHDGGDALLALILLLGFCAFCIHIYGDVSDAEWPFAKYHIPVGVFNTLLCLFCFLVLVAFIGATLIRLAAGFCYSPIAILNNTINDPTITYYLTCDQMSDNELRAANPWEDSRAEAEVELSSIDATLDTLASNPSLSNADMESMRSNYRAVCHEVTGDNGLFGYQGLLSCGFGNRLVQDVVVALCDEVFTPAESLLICAMLLLALVVFLNIASTYVRREPNEMHPQGAATDDDAVGDQLTHSKDDPPPAYIQPPSDYDTDVRCGARLPSQDDYDPHRSGIVDAVNPVYFKPTDKIDI